MPDGMTSSTAPALATAIAQSLDKIDAALGIIEPALAQHGALRADVRDAIGQLDALIGDMDRSNALPQYRNLRLSDRGQLSPR